MKTKLFIILLTIIPSMIYCQEVPEDSNFHFIEAGIGSSISRSDKDVGVLTVAISNGLGKYLANFIDYNMGFNKSTINSHEFSFKIGPYFRYNNYSYIAFSTGLSYYNGVLKSNWTDMYGRSEYQKENIFSIPIQAKVNIEIAKGFSFGLKGTYNKPIEKDKPERTTAMMFLSYGWH